jgi:hypothetical protein
VEFHDVPEAHLLSIELDESMMYAGLLLRSIDSANGRIDVISLDGVPVQMQVQRLSLHAGLVTVEGVPSLGEIETFSLEDHRLMLHGDFGCIEFIAGRIEIVTVK